jgi:hypothetical protein
MRIPEGVTEVFAMGEHAQLFTKVNAPVDVGVSGIISALSEFSALSTFESCQGDEERGPWVCFRYGEYWKHPWRELADFVLGYLAPGLMEAVGDDATVRIEMTPSGQIFGEISVRPGADHRVEQALWELVRNFSVSQFQRSGRSDDTSDTSQKTGVRSQKSQENQKVETRN